MGDYTDINHENLGDYTENMGDYAENMGDYAENIWGTTLKIYGGLHRHDTSKINYKNYFLARRAPITLSIHTH